MGFFDKDPEPVVEDTKDFLKEAPSHERIFMGLQEMQKEPLEIRSERRIAPSL